MALAGPSLNSLVAINSIEGGFDYVYGGYFGYDGFNETLTDINNAIINEEDYEIGNGQVLEFSNPNPGTWVATNLLIETEDAKREASVNISQRGIKAEEKANSVS